MACGKWRGPNFNIVTYVQSRMYRILFGICFSCHFISNLFISVVHLFLICNCEIESDVSHDVKLWNNLIFFSFETFFIDLFLIQHNFQTFYTLYVDLNEIILFINLYNIFKKYVFLQNVICNTIILDFTKDSKMKQKLIGKYDFQNFL